MSDELVKTVIDWVEHIRSISDDPEIAHIEEKLLWHHVLASAAVGRDVEKAAKEALKTTDIDFPRWFA